MNRIIERHLDFKRAEQVEGGRHVYTWATQNVMPVKDEMFAPDSSLPVMSIAVGAQLAWGETGHSYDDLSKDRYVLRRRASRDLIDLLRLVSRDDAEFVTITVPR